MKEWHYWVIACVALFAAVFSASYFLLSSKQTREPAPERQFSTYTSEKTGVIFRYDRVLRQTDISAEDKEKNIDFRLIGAASDPDFLITLRFEDKLKPLSTLMHKDLQSILLDNISKDFPKRYPEFSQKSSRNFEVSGKPASEIVFTYKNKGETLKQRFALILASDDMAAYLSAQAKESDFEQLNTKYFDKIFDSLEVK